MKKILCVDDELEILEIIKFDLEMEGFNVTIANSVDAALEVCRTEVFDYVLSDVKMPGKDGKEFAKELRSRGLMFPMAFLSGFCDVDAEFLKLYAVDCVLSKPYQPAQVFAHLQRSLS